MKGNAKPERWERGEQADARGEEEKGDKTRRRTKPRSAPPGAERTAPRYAAAPRARGARPHPRGRQRGGRSPQPYHHRPFSQPNAAPTASLPSFPSTCTPPPVRTRPDPSRSLPAAPSSASPTSSTNGSGSIARLERHHRLLLRDSRRPPPRPARTAQQVKRPSLPAGTGPAPRGSLVSVRPAASVGSQPALRPSGPLRTSRAAARAPTAERRRPVRLHSNDPRPWGGCAFRGQG